MKKNNVRVEQLGYNWLKLSFYTIVESFRPKIRIYELLKEM
jgi:hypothetical protein